MDFTRYTWYHYCTEVMSMPVKAEEQQMTMQEMTRFILGLRNAGWSEEKINDFIVFIESGDEKYKPGKEED